MRNEKLFWPLATISVLVFWLGWIVIYASLSDNIEHRWLYPTLVLFFASLVYYLFIIIVHKIRDLVILTAIIILPSVMLGGNYWYNMTIAWVVANLLYYIAIRRIKKEQHSRTKISAFFILRRGVPIIGTALSLLIASGYYFSMISKQMVGELPKFEIEISQKVTKSGLKGVNYIVPTDEVEWILDGATVDEYIMRTMESQGSFGQFQAGQPVEAQGGEGSRGIEGISLPEITKEQQQQFIVLNRNTLEQQLGVELTGDERMDDLINTLVNMRVNDLLNGKMFSASVVPLGAAFAMFLTVRSLIWIFNFMLYWIVTGIIKIFIKAKLIVIKKETVEVERI